MYVFDKLVSILDVVGVIDVFCMVLSVFESKFKFVVRMRVALNLVMSTRRVRYLFFCFVGCCNVCEIM